MRVVVVHNPDAGDAAGTAADLRAAVSAAGHEVDLRVAHGTAWRRALDPGVDLVAVAGGDGTVGEVLTSLGGSGRRVAILPVGTANNVARTLGIPLADPAAAVAAWGESAARRFDLPLVRRGPFRRRLVEGVGGGLVAELLAQADEAERRGLVGGGLADAHRILRRVVERADSAPWTVEVDGRERTGRFLAVEVVNIRRLGPILDLAPDADPTDGLVEVVLVEEAHREALAAHARSLAARSPDGDRAPAVRVASPAPAFEVLRGRQVVLHPPDGAALHLDDRPLPADVGDRGDGPADGRIAVEVDGEAVEVLVPSSRGAPDPGGGLTPGRPGV